MVRIIAGTAKGVRLRVVGKKGCRPTPDRLKEALFSVLGDKLDGIKVLDLFAGTGSLGLETLSRNAAFACFVEDNHERVSELNEKVKTLGFENRAAVIEMNALRAGKLLARKFSPFDLIFADPPYHWLEAHQEDLFNLIGNQDLLTKNGTGIFVLESSGDTEIQEPLGQGWKIEKRIKIATSKVTVMLWES